LKKIYHKFVTFPYKWVVAAVCFLVLFIGLGFCSTAKTIFIEPITKAFGFPRSVFTINDSFRYITVTVVTLFFDILVRKLGTKKLLLMGIACYIISSLIYALAGSLPLFYIAGIFLGLGVSWCSTTMISVIINRWFDKNKGTVLGVIFASNALGSATAIYLTTPIIYSAGNPFGYRKAYLLITLFLIVLLIITAIFFKDKTVSNIAEPSKKGVKRSSGTWKGFEYKELRKMPAFYTVVISIFFITVSQIGGVVTPHFIDIGFDPSFVTTAITVSNIALAIFKILMGVFYDKFGIRVTLNCCLISSLLAKTLLLIITPTAGGKFLTILFELLIAVGTTAETVMLPIIALALFGEVSFNKTLALLTSVCAGGHILASPILNIPYDITGSYKISFIFVSIISALVLIAMNFAMSDLAIMRNKIKILDKMEE